MSHTSTGWYVCNTHQDNEKKSRHFRLFRVEVAPSQDEQVKALPDIELDGENLVDDDSDLEQTSQEKKEQAIEASRSFNPVGWSVGLLCFSAVFLWWLYVLVPHHPRTQSSRCCICIIQSRLRSYI